MHHESPEIFSIAVIDGLRPRSVDMKMEYGNLHHLMDEVYGNAIAGLAGLAKSSQKTALKIATDRVMKYVALRSTGLPRATAADLTTAALQVVAIYPHYLYHHRHHDIRWIARESVFRVKFDVPAPIASSGLPSRYVTLTGKRDGLYKTRDQGVVGIGLWEIKTKTKIDRAHLAEQLRCDSQSLFYLYATLLECRQTGNPLRPIQETYDVIKRPALKRHQRESVEAYVKRCADRVAEKPNEFFAREVISLREHELDAYAAQFLLPEVRHFLEWWESVKSDPSPEGRRKSSLHYLKLSALIHAWGKSPYYEALVETQSSRTLRSIEVPFPELHDDFERAEIEAKDDINGGTSLSQKKPGLARKVTAKQVDAALERLRTKKKTTKKRSCSLLSKK